MGRVLHLASRLLSVLRARPLLPSEQQQVAGWLSPAEAALFWTQAAHDQRHGFNCARSLLAAHPDRVDLVAAGLLHDVGKHLSGLGATARSVASVLASAHLPLGGRLRLYCDHAALGAEELEAAEAAPTTVAYARHHHSSPPPGTDPDDWAALVAADR